MWGIFLRTSLSTTFQPLGPFFKNTWIFFVDGFATTWLLKHVIYKLEWASWTQPPKNFRLWSATCKLPPALATLLTLPHPQLLKAHLFFQRKEEKWRRALALAFLHPFSELMDNLAFLQVGLYNSNMYLITYTLIQLGRSCSSEGVGTLSICRSLKNQVSIFGKTVR